MSEASLLEAVGAVAARETDVRAMLAGVSTVLFKSFADMCFYDLRTGDGAIERHVEISSGIDASVVPLVASLAPPAQAFRAGHPFPLAVMRGETVLVERADDAWRRDAAATSEVDDVWRRVGYHSILSVPVRSSGHVLGALTMLRSSTLRPFDAVDASAGEQIGRHVGAAVSRLGYVSKRFDATSTVMCDSDGCGRRQATATTEFRRSSK